MSEALGRLKRYSAAIVLGSLFAVGLASGSGFYGAYTEAGHQPFFYQRIFGPAVMLACGRGFVNPSLEHAPALAEFLAVSVDEFSCAELPAELPQRSFGELQGITSYLLVIVGGTWSLTGVSWSALAPLCGVLWGVVLLLLYGLFRLGMGRLLAVALTLLLAVSTLQLNNLPHFRDSFKVPFLLGALLIIGWLVARPGGRRRYLALCALGGLTMGLGLGFRTDLIVMVPPLVLAITCFAPARAPAARPASGIPALRAVAPRLQGVLVFGLVLVAAGWPVLAAYGRGVSPWHIALLGLSPQFDENLGVSPSLYELGYAYNDMHVYTTLRGYVDRTGLDAAFVDPYSNDYVRASARYYLEIATGFPADLLVRGYAAVLRMLELPFRPPAMPPPVAESQPVLAAVSSLRSRLIGLPLATGWAAAALACMGIAAVDLRRALAFLLGVLYLGATTGIHFQERHVFHLEFVALWALGFLLYQSARAVMRWVSRSGARGALQSRIRPETSWWPPLRRLIIVAGVLVALVPLPLFAARVYQRAAVERWLTAVAQARRVPLSTTSSVLGGRVLIEAPDLLGGSKSEPGANLIDSSYVAAEFDAGGTECDFAPFLPVTFRYRSDLPRHDFTHTVALATAGRSGRSTVFFPVHRLHGIDVDFGFRIEPANASFAGIELPGETLACFRGLSEVADVPPPFLTLPVGLPADWRSEPLYQTLGRGRRDGSPGFFTAPADLLVRRHLLDELQPAELEVTFQAEIVERTGDGALEIDGRADGAYTYLLTTEAAPLAGGRLLVARGELLRGGFTLGVLEDDQWAASVNVTEPGPFDVIIRIPREGADTIVLANCIRGGWLQNEFTITRLGWLD